RGSARTGGEARMSDPQAAASPPSVPADGERPHLELIGVCKTFGRVEILSKVDLAVSRGETVCVVGPSGSGKSTMLRCVNMLAAPTSGVVKLDGLELTHPRTNLNR